MTADDRAGITRLSTGVNGLDVVLGGGLLTGGVYIVQGSAGSGKTILANQICFHAAASGRHAAYLTLLGESHARMISHLRGLSFFDPREVPAGVCYLSAFKVLEADGLMGLRRTMQTAVQDRQASLMVLDGVGAAREASGDPIEYKKFLHELQAFVNMCGCSVLLLSGDDAPAECRPEYTLVDGVIELGQHLQGVRSRRSLRVYKLRGSAPLEGQHALEITGAGVIVHPRLETQLRARFETSDRPESHAGQHGSDGAASMHDDANEAVSPGQARAAFGIADLDRMMCGGLPTNSNTMVLGPSGSGKTILGLQFLAEGARSGEAGIYFGFYERPRSILLKSQRINLGLHQPAVLEQLQFMWQSPVEGVIDLIAERLLTAVRRTPGVRRLVIDGLHGLESAAEFPDRVAHVLSALLEELQSCSVTTLYTVETQDLIGPEIEVPIGGLSNITHNIVVLRHVELSAHLYRLISIVKIRDSDYDSGIREFRITGEGIVVADTFQSAERILSGIAHLQPGAKLPGGDRDRPMPHGRPRSSSSTRRAGR